MEKETEERRPHFVGPLFFLATDKSGQKRTKDKNGLKIKTKAV